MPKKIVAIGSGNIRTRGTAAIDQEIIRLSGKKRPKLLLIPTASSDSAAYWLHVRQYFDDFWKCMLDVLWLIENRPTLKEIAKKISWADIIYVGGGNTLTLMMMCLWRRLGIDKLLKHAWYRGTVLCGISAGSICWFASGHSDSMSFYNPRKWKYIRVKRLGLIAAIYCPHYNGSTLYVPRRKAFQAMIRQSGGVSIAIENNCAMEFLDDRFRVIRSNDYAQAYKVYKRHGKVIAERIPQGSFSSPRRLSLENEKNLGPTIMKKPGLLPYCAPISQTPPSGQNGAA